MTALARDSGGSGALFAISGEIPNNATWQENIYFSEAGTPTVLTGLAFKMTFRGDPESTSADYTLSTTDGTLTVATDPDSGIANVLYINVAAGAFSGMRGEYIADLASQDVGGVVTLWAHGLVAFRPNPVSF